MNRLEKLENDFKILADKERLSHAYLFFGEAGDEKFSFAECLANYLEKGKFEKPEKILEETLIVSADEKGNIGIDKIRQLSDFLYRKPALSKKRIAIVRQSEAMSPEAQNAALKITEEAPPQTLIIFISQSEYSLLLPLVSRLQKIYFPKTQINAERTLINTEILNLPIDKIVENDKIDDYFKSLIAELRRDPIKNSPQLREALKRLSAIKMFNVNKKLQLKCLF